MMKKIVWIVCAGLLTVLLNGCGTTAGENFENSSRLRVGMTKEQVKEIMGEPLQENFSKPDVWYYYIETRWHDGQNTIDECMPVVFKNNKLAGWGNAYYKQLKLVKKSYEKPEIEGLK